MSDKPSSLIDIFRMMRKKTHKTELKTSCAAKCLKHTQELYWHKYNDCPPSKMMTTSSNTISLAWWLRRPPQEQKTRVWFSHSPWEFFQVESYQWYKNWNSSGYPDRCQALLGQCWDWLAQCQHTVTEEDSLTCSFYLSMAACTTVWADTPLQNKKTEATDNSEASTSEFTHQTTYLKCDHGEVS